ncbi:MAG: hypothetical protein HPY45_03240 [Anaerolineae bacterium]|nr:hypothetical protein [Anaerolineae bacterium]
MLIFEPCNDRVRWMTYDGYQLNSGEFNTSFNEVMRIATKLISQATCVSYILQNGGSLFNQPVVPLTPEHLENLEKVVPYHYDANNTTYRLACTGLDLFAHIPQYICCNTAFFYGLPPYAKYYALPYELTQKGINRFGGDGLYHQWTWEIVQEKHPGCQRLISINLHENPNVAAIANGNPVETSLGFSCLEGIPSATGCGSIDPTIPLELMRADMSATSVEYLLARQSGWNNLVGTPMSLAELLQSPSHPQKLAREIILNNLIKAIGACMAAMNGADILVFNCVGLSEMLPSIREICNQFSFTGIKTTLPNDNASKTNLELNAPDSPIKIIASEYRLAHAIFNMCYSSE